MGVLALIASSSSSPKIILINIFLVWVDKCKTSAMSFCHY